MSDTELWQVEYAKAGIPSSIRSQPSGAVTTFVKKMRELGVDTGHALDIGCGRGRNSLYLAQQGFSVTALELVAELVDSVNKVAYIEQLDVTAVQHDLRFPWPLSDNHYDVAIDTFCYKHQTADGAAQHYRNELARLLRPGALYLLTLAGIDDGYYGPLLVNSSLPNKQMIIDPANGISSLLYSKEKIVDDFSGAFSIISYEHKIKQGFMHGKEYSRSTHIFIMRRNNLGFKIF